MPALIDQRGMDFIGQDARVILFRQFDQAGEVVLVQHTAERIIGIGQQNRARARLEGALNIVELQAGLDLLAARGARQLQKRWVGRNWHDHGGVLAGEVLHAEQ